MNALLQARFLSPLGFMLSLATLPYISEDELWRQGVWVRVLPLPLPGWVTLMKALNAPGFSSFCKVKGTGAHSGQDRL